MADVLILYGSTDGQTAKIAGALAETLTQEGLGVDVVDSARAGNLIRPEPYRAVIVAASLHAGGYQIHVRRWVRHHAAALRQRPTALVSVCLAILEKRPEARHEIDRILARFVAEQGWKPDQVHVVAGALKYTRYGWLKRWIMRRIVARAGGDTDTSRDYEYTDWDDLRRFARAFADEHALRPAPTTLAAGLLV